MALKYNFGVHISPPLFSLLMTNATSTARRRRRHRSSSSSSSSKHVGATALRAHAHAQGTLFAEVPLFRRLVLHPCPPSHSKPHSRPVMHTTITAYSTRQFVE